MGCAEEHGRLPSSPVSPHPVLSSCSRSPHSGVLATLSPIWVWPQPPAAQSSHRPAVSSQQEGVCEAQGPSLHHVCDLPGALGKDRQHPWLSARAPSWPSSQPWCSYSLGTVCAHARPFPTLTHSTCLFLARLASTRPAEAARAPCPGTQSTAPHLVLGVL